MKRTIRLELRPDAILHLIQVIVSRRNIAPAYHTDSTGSSWPPVARVQEIGHKLLTDWTQKADVDSGALPGTKSS
jgi:hypothetical protein